MDKDQRFVLQPEAIRMVEGRSKGAQPKYYENRYWYKLDQKGYEGLSEYLISLVLKHSNVKNYVAYECCVIGGKKGCCSLNFLKPEESYISFQRLFDLYDGTSLLGRIIVMDDVAERISYVKKFVLEKTGFDCGAYLSRILTLDMLTLNNDRHFNNLGLIANAKTNSVYEAPIFDNGAGLLSDFGEFPAEDSLEENIARVKGKPFCASLELQAYHAGFGLSLDYDGLYRELAGENVTVSDNRMSNSEVKGGYYSFALFLYGFLGVIALISVFNIINSISMSVSARIREYGAMRAIGMGSRQMIRMVAAEAATYVAWGILFGCAAGLFLNYEVYDILITGRWGTPWYFPAGALAVILAAVILAAVAAVHGPAKRIREMSIVDTISAL